MKFPSERLDRQTVYASKSGIITQVCSIRTPTAKITHNYSISSGSGACYVELTLKLDRQCNDPNPHVNFMNQYGAWSSWVITKTIGRQPPIKARVSRWPELFTSASSHRRSTIFRRKFDSCARTAVLKVAQSPPPYKPRTTRSDTRE